ncbi:MAG: Na+:solute symporter [Spirochaetes bacterium]|nr:Na+:solute symporter [Spirochaetota bacterium]
MSISFPDVLLIAVYFIVSFIIAIYFSKRAGKSTEEFFLSGRKLPWWIAGTGMVATTFSADTPLAVTELVAQNGISGNWLWWNMVAGSVFTVFFFAKLWRRANILTDVEFIEIRYSGKPAAFLRGFKAIYLGLFMNCIIMGWVNVALAEIIRNIFGLSEGFVIISVIACMLIVGIYSAIAGLWGIVITDFFQFIMAMAGCIILSVIIINLPQIGGIDGLKRALPEQVFHFLPTLNFSGGQVAGGIIALSFSAFLAHIFVQWWASWYPGAEPGGGGYIAQRMMSAKDERHSLLSTLWFSIAHYALRPWPWIIVALCSLVLYPDLAPEAKKTGYILAMKDYLPSGLLGLTVAAFLAAYMSTISTHLNWGSSYIMNDLYKRFMKKGGTERHYVVVSKIITLILVAISSLLILVINSISGAWAFIIECGAGLGLVLILRWYWWRINAWSEIVAMLAPFAGYSITKFVLKISFPESLFFIVLFSTIAWVIATFVTKPTDSNKLLEFYKRVLPGGPGWKKVDDGQIENKSEKLTSLFINWIMGIVLVYTSLFGIGKIIFKEYLPGFVLLIIAVVLFTGISLRLKKNTAAS